MIALIYFNSFFIIPLLSFYFMLLSYSIKHLTIPFKITTPKQKKTHEDILLLCVLGIALIFFWRYIRKDRVILIKDIEMQFTSLKTMLSHHIELLQLTFLSKTLLIITLILLLFCILLLGSLVKTYIRGKLYVYHIYCLNNNRYTRIFSFFDDIQSKPVLYSTNSFLYFVQKRKNPEKNKLFWQFFLFAANESFFYKAWFKIFTTTIPFYLVIYEIFVYEKLQLLFFMLPWLFVLLVSKSAYKFYYSDRRFKEHLSDDLRSFYAYKKPEFSAYKLHCSSLTITN